MSVAAPAAWPLRCALREVPGYAFGFLQPSVQVQLTMRPMPETSWAQAATALDALLEPDAATSPAPTPAAPLTPQGVAQRVLLAVQALQRRAGLVLEPTMWLPAPETAPAGDELLLVDAALPMPHPAATRDAFRFVVGVANRALLGSTHNTAAERASALVSTLRQGHDEGQNMPYFVQAALDMKLPVARLAPQVLRVGWGARQRQFCSTLTERTSPIGLRLARDKYASAVLLRQIGLPGAHNEPVATAEAAVALARRWGYPLVVKPRDRDGGQGVAADLRDDTTLRAAWAEARRCSPHVLLERHVDGHGHRLTVALGRVIKATLKTPWGVTGDGTRSIAALVADPPPEDPPQPRATPLPTALDAEALGMLQQQGLAADSVLEAGRFVSLRRRNNAVAGGSSKRLDINSVHPDNVQLALRASEVMGLDVAGVDLIVADIGQSWTTQRAVICEVNAQPQTDPKTLALWLQETLGPQGVRVPVWLALLAEANAAAPAAQLMSSWALALGADAWASAAQACVAGELLAGLPGDGWATAQALLASPRVNAMLLVLPLRTVQRQGLPVDRLQGCWVAPDAAALASMLAQASAQPMPRPLMLAPSVVADGQTMAWLATALKPHLRPL